MFRWVPYAMVRIAAFFIAGILLGIRQPDLVPRNWVIVLITFLVICFATLKLIKVKNHNLILGVVGLLAVATIGYLHVQLADESTRRDHVLNFRDKIEAYKASVIDLPEKTEKMLKYEVRIEEVFDGHSWIKASGKCLLYLRKDSLSNTFFFYGDKVMVNGAPQPVKGPANPYEFDFKAYLGFKNIFLQDFVSTGDVAFLTSPETKSLRYYSFKARQWAIMQFEERLPGTRERAIALALVLGVTEEIDNALRSAYASSGAMHVLAVSGLHVGIVYAIVLLLFKPIQTLAWSRWLVAIVSLLILWSFAFISGLSPSVLRAVTMFSFIAIARPFGRRTNTYNTLAASAFILLMYNPYLIMSVGFQLSFLAVLGIVAVYRPLYQMIEPQSRALDWIWSITCVSIAAQLATVPLGLLYFHQFPVYFLLANLFVIPGATFVLVLGLFTSLTSGFPTIATLMGQILSWTIQGLNYAVITVDGLPFGLVENIYISPTQSFLLFLALSFLFLLLKSRQFVFMVAAFGAIAFFSILQWTHYFHEVKTERFVVYSTSRLTNCEWISNGASFLVRTGNLEGDSSPVDSRILPLRMFAGVEATSVVTIEKDREVFVWRIGDKTIGLIGKPITSFPENLLLDYLIVGNDAFRSLDQIQKLVKFEKLILDATNTGYIAESIKGENPSVVYSVIQEGAYHEKF